MKYYKLTNSINVQEIGKYDQSITTKVRGNICDLGEFGKILEEIVLPEPIMVSKAKATTYLQSVPINSLKFLILKNYFINFLKEFNIFDFQTWNLKVHHRKSILKDYSLFHLSYPSQEKYIDYRESDFLIGKLGDWKDTSTRKPIKVNNYNNFISLIEVLKESEENSQIRCEKLVLDLRNVNEDIFRLTTQLKFGSGYYISENLKKAIEKNNYTGMAFKEISEVNNKIEVIY